MVCGVTVKVAPTAVLPSLINTLPVAGVPAGVLS